MRRGWLRRLSPFLIVALLAGAALLLRHELSAYRYADIRHSLATLPLRRLELAVALTLLSYAILTGYDALALRYLQHPLPYRHTALASFLGYAFSHNVGLSVLGGAAPRYRLYSAWRLAPAEITLLIAFTAVTLWVGIVTVTGTVLVADPEALAASAHLSATAAREIGCGFLLALAAYVVAGAVWRRPLTFRGWVIPAPSHRVLLAQVVLAVVDWAAAAGVLYVLLPGGVVSFTQLLAIFVVAQVAGLASYVPGGLGVFETAIVLALRHRAPTPTVISSLLVYRAVYYLLPLTVATMLLAVFEVVHGRERLGHIAMLVGRWLPEVAPRVLAIATFATGTLLLLSGALPRHTTRLSWLATLLPLSVLEASHFLSSLIGLGLVLLANGLQRRLDAAYHLTVVLLIAGAFFALLKGFDYEESLVLLGMLAALLPCRAEFHRPASLVGERFTFGWAAAVGVVVVASLELGFFVHQHTEYSHELWWQFSLFGDAPRFLRASVGVGVAALTFAGLHLLRPARLHTVPPDSSSLAAVRTIIGASPVAAAHLALLSDKAFLFSENRRAVIMYAVSGRSCVAMGDPLGPPAQCTELIWTFCELCERHDSWPVFYEATAGALPLYLDAGLTPFKFGEEARVNVGAFTLEGSERKQQRYVVRSIERDGGTFEVRPPTDVPALLPELRAISDRWLRDKHAREKAFSMGHFDAHYLAEFPIALVRWHGTIVAFANLWCAGTHEEVSPDLMRYTPEAPPSVMEYLFLRLISWAKDERYRWLTLGMAPLAGLEARASAPLWNRLGAFAFRHGEHFYNFQGLRQFKDKFDPEWRPKYLISPGGIVLPRVLANMATLVSGGLRGVVAK